MDKHIFDATEKNIAFIDGQNLYGGTQSENWQIDFMRFKIYLEKKFYVQKAYYFLGFLNENEEKLYRKLQESGFIVIFREHNAHMKGKKKGNVDVDICFEMMKNYADNKNFDKIVLVSGDGDYIKPVKYLIEKNKIKKILFPNCKYSSLYKSAEFRALGINLNQEGIKKKIEYKKRSCP